MFSVLKMSSTVIQLLHRASEGNLLVINSVSCVLYQTPCVQSIDFSCVKACTENRGFHFAPL